MLTPRIPLLVLVGGLLAPLAVAGGLRPAFAPVAVLAAVLLAVTAAIDAWLCQRRAGRGLTFEFPEIVRLSKGRPGGISFVALNDRPGAPARSLRVGLGFPDGIRTPDEELDAQLATGVARTLFTWPCTGERRGTYRLERVYYREDSPLRLWSVRRSHPAGTELRVYPDLRAERRQAAAVFLTRQGIGTHAQRQVGRGRDFEKLRDYVAGDSIEDISWKATARRQRPVSKVFQVERTQEVYVIVDASRLSGRSAEGSPAPDVQGADEAGVLASVQRAVVPTVLERYVSSALMLCMAAQRQGDLFGLATFAAGVQRFLRAKNGAAHFDACREAIYALEPVPATPDFDELSTFLRLRLRRRALLVFLTSLDDPLQSEAFTRAVERVSRQHVVIVGSLRPAGVAPLFTDPDGGAGVTTAEDVYQRLGGHLQWQKLRERELLLRRAGVRVALLDSARMTEQLVTQYMNVKRRQIL